MKYFRQITLSFEKLGIEEGGRGVDILVRSHLEFSLVQYSEDIRCVSCEVSIGNMNCNLRSVIDHMIKIFL